MKILIFTEGTAIMHALAKDVPVPKRVEQSANQVQGIDDFRTYIPNGNVVAKLQKWKEHGAGIYYLTSRTLPSEIGDVCLVLKSNHFPDSDNLLFRKEGQGYKDVAESLMPDILIEDDCKSIGGESEMTYPHISSELKPRIQSIIVAEFAGIDDLPDDITQLRTIEGKPPRKEV